MKNGNTTKSAALLALMGLMKVSTAHADGHTFTPLENLPPEQRQAVAEQVNELTKNINVDWDNIVVGVDENGKPTLVQRSEIELVHVSSPSSFGASAQRAEENQ